jgi:hypothetical protein
VPSTTDVLRSLAISFAFRLRRFAIAQGCHGDPAAFRQR